MSDAANSKNGKHEASPTPCPVCEHVPFLASALLFALMIFAAVFYRSAIKPAFTPVPGGHGCVNAGADREFPNLCSTTDRQSIFIVKSGSLTPLRQVRSCGSTRQQRRSTPVAMASIIMSSYFSSLRGTGSSASGSIGFVLDAFVETASLRIVNAKCTNIKVSRI